MAWTIEYLRPAKKALDKLDPRAADRITRFMRERIEPLDDPRALGDALQGKMSDLWRYRIGDFRVICDIQDKSLMVLVVRIGDRKEVYRR